MGIDGCHKACDWVVTRSGGFAIGTFLAGDVAWASRAIISLSYGWVGICAVTGF